MSKAKEKMYSTGDIISSFDIQPITVYKRFASKYAKKRWGVEEHELPNGDIMRFVPKSKLYLWVENPTYIGKPREEDVK